MEYVLKPRGLAFSLLLGALLLVLAGSAWFSAPQTTSAATSGTFAGYAWSENIGWIDMSGLTLDYASGNITGYAWSENIGWVKFGGLSSFPSAPWYSAKINAAGDQLLGWARACAGTASGDCSSMTSRTDGWDGWILLNGVTITGGSFDKCDTGYPSCAWGSDVVGWIDFSKVTIPAQATYTLTVNKLGAAGSVTGSVGTTNISCSAANCLYTLNEGDYGSLNANIAGGSTDFVWSGGLCSGTSNPCSVPALTAPKTVTATFNITASPPAGCLSTSASSCIHSTTVRRESTTMLYWTTTNTTLPCTLSGTNGNSIAVGDSLSGSGPTNAIQQKTIYTLSCPAQDGVSPAFTDTATINLVPTFQEI